MAQRRKLERVSVYVDAELKQALKLWRIDHMPLESQTKAIERIIRDRIEQDAKKELPDE